MVAPLTTAGVSDEVAQEEQMPVGLQMLEDVEEPMPARPATLRDPGTPDQIVMKQHNLTHCPSQPWCEMCVESRGHDSPHREQSKIDAVVPQLPLDYGYMGDGALCRKRASSWEQTPLLEPSTRRWYRTPRRWTSPRCRNNSQLIDCVAWGTHSTQKINDMNYSQLISDPSTYVKKRAQRSDDSILLRHMDDVVGTRP